MKNCQHCGGQIADDAKFCPSCGAAASAPSQTVDPFATEGLQGQGSQPPVAGSQYGQPPPTSSQPQPQYGQAATQPQYGGQNGKELHIQLICVVSLVFMILFAIRSFGNVAAIRTWMDIQSNVSGTSVHELLQRIVMCVIVATILSVVVLIAMIMLRLSSHKVRNQAQPPEVRVAQAHKVRSVAIFTLVCAVLYAVCELAFSGSLMSLLDVADFTSEVESEVQAALAGSVAFCLTLTVFSIVNVIKASAFIKFLKIKLQFVSGER